MATQPGLVINRRVVLLVLAIIAFAIGAFLEFAKVAVEANVIFGLLFVDLAFFAGAFL